MTKKTTDLITHVSMVKASPIREGNKGEDSSVGTKVKNSHNSVDSVYLEYILKYTFTALF